MKNLQFKNSFFNKTVAIVLVAAFSFYNCDISLAIPDADIKAPDVTAESSMLSVEDIGIAIDAGTVRSKFTGETGRTIVHIQDAHCNFEAQSNISRILEQLSKDSGIDMISVEGAEGNVDTAWFRAFPDAEIRREVATYFMKKGEITGAEFFSINSDYDGTIFGAETRDYYVQNLRAFLDMYPYKDSIIEYLNGLKSVGGRLKSIIYPPKLKELDRNINAFEHKEMDLSKYAEYLEKASIENEINRRMHGNFGKLIDTLEYEKKIDFDIVDGERTRYIDSISEMLSKEDMAELVAQSIRFKKGYIKSVDFYSHLRDLAKEHNIPMLQEYPNLFYYYIYSKIYDGIEIEELFREIDIIERALKEALIKDDVQLKLDKFSEKVDKLISLVNIELTNDDYDRFSQMAGAFSINDVVDFYGSMAVRYNLNYSMGTVPDVVRENLPKMVDFYEIAIKRDMALVENTLAQMEKEGKDRSVLIAGGFHTRGMVDLLQRKGISYVVVTPKITKDVESPYIQVLTNQRTSIEEIITESAMPGTKTLSSEGSSGAGASDMLAPPVISWAISLGESGLKNFLKGLPDEFINGLVDKAEEVKEESNSMSIKLWLRKVIENASPEGTTIPEKIEGIKELLNNNEYKKVRERLSDGTYLAVLFYLRMKEDPEVSDSPEILQYLETTYVEYGKLCGELGLTVSFESLMKDPQWGLGRQAVGEVLTPEEDGIFRTVLRQKFSERKPGGNYEESVPGVDGFVIQLHDGLVEALVNAGIPLNKAVNIRPSTYDGRQMDIDRAIFDRLPEEVVRRIVDHEMAHIAIAIGRESGLGALQSEKEREAFAAWQEWKDKTPQGQEKLLSELGYDVSDIQDNIAMMSIGILVRGTADVYPDDVLRVAIDRGDPVPGANDLLEDPVHTHEAIVILEKAHDPKDADVAGVHEQIDIVGPGTVKAPEILEGRQYFVHVESGEVEVTIDGKTKQLAVWTAIDPSEKPDFRKTGPRSAVLKFYYSPNERETRAYTTLAAVVKHAGTLAEMTEPVMVHAPKRMFASSDIGSVKWIQDMMRRLTHPEFRLSEYQDLKGFGVRDLKEGYTHVVIGTQTDLTNSLKDDKISSNLSSVRVLPIEDNAVSNPNASWDFSVEAVSWAVIAGAATPLQIQALQDGNDFTSPAADIYKFLTRIRKPDKEEELKPRDLYMMMPYKEIQDAVTTTDVKKRITIDEDFFDNFLADVGKRITNLVKQILFTMPIKPFNPMKALKSRLKVMWSV